MIRLYYTFQSARVVFELKDSTASIFTILAMEIRFFTRSLLPSNLMGLPIGWHANLQVPSVYIGLIDLRVAFN